MVSYLMRETLMDALAAGPPHKVNTRHVDSRIQVQLLTELQHRGLISCNPFPVLTEAGIAEAKWFTNSGLERDNHAGDGAGKSARRASDI